MAQETNRTVGQHVFKTVVYSDVKEKGKTVKQLPHPAFTLDQDGLENALGYYGSVGQLVANLNRIIKTDSRNDYAEAVGSGKSAEQIKKERGFEILPDKGGFKFTKFSKGLGMRRVSDPITFHLNRAKDPKLSPRERLEHMDEAKRLISESVATPQTEEEVK